MAWMKDVEVKGMLGKDEIPYIWYYTIYNLQLLHRLGKPTQKTFQTRKRALLT